VRQKTAIRMLKNALEALSQSNLAVSCDINEDISQLLAALKLKVAQAMAGPRPSDGDCRAVFGEIDLELSLIMARLRGISEVLSPGDVVLGSDVNLWECALRKADPAISEQSLGEIFDLLERIEKPGHLSI
jgi:hypothetical protein